MKRWNAVLLQVLTVQLWLSPVAHNAFAQSAFNPEIFKLENKEDYRAYVNEPLIIPENIDNLVTSALSLPIESPYGLLHEADALGSDALMGLAAYAKNMRAFTRIVGPLRNSGYDGHIILGVSPSITEEEQDYLKRNNVTYYAVEFVDCDDSITQGSGTVRGAIRGKCAKGLETLKLEWGRYEMARQWLYACTKCTGWSMVMDTRDIFFQSHPFLSLGDPKSSDADLFFVEEIAPHTSPDPNPVRSFVSANFRNKAHTVPCYGDESYERYGKRPVLCSGTVLGNREGMVRFLSVLVTEFHANNRKENVKCRSPITTDQWTMNWLYYNGYFGKIHRTKTIPWGVGPVQTVGKACVGADKKTGASDIVTRENGFIVNIHEPPESKSRIAATIHQFDRCSSWISDYFGNQENLFKDFLALKGKSKTKKTRPKRPVVQEEEADPAL